MIATEVEIAWIAGLLEGEGYFAYASRSQVVRLDMTDADVVLKYIDIVERIVGSRPRMSMRSKGSGRQDSYYVALNGESARIVMRLIIPHMCYRRRAKIWQSLNKYVPGKMQLPSNFVERLVQMEPCHDNSH